MHYSLDTLKVAIHHEAELTDMSLRRVAGSTGLLLGTMETAHMSEQVRILVTGAGGFIGHHLVTYLKKQGYWVRGVDVKHPEYGTTDADEFASIGPAPLGACAARH